jgi:outer membrane protein assembly factor BamB
VLDDDYSIREYVQIPYIDDEDIISFAVDEYDNFWVLSDVSYSNDGEVFLRKWDKPGGNLLSECILPDSLLLWAFEFGFFGDLIVYQNTVYCPSSNGKVYKLNPATGDIVGYIQPPDRSFLNLSSIAIKENGNILAVEDAEPGILWELSNSGDSINAFVLPDMDYYYSDIACSNGTVYISTPRYLLRIGESGVDTFYE